MWVVEVEEGSPAHRSGEGALLLQRVTWRLVICDTVVLRTAPCDSAHLCAPAPVSPDIPVIPARGLWGRPAPCGSSVPSGEKPPEWVTEAQAAGVSNTCSLVSVDGNKKSQTLLLLDT